MRNMTESAPALPTTSDIATQAAQFSFLATTGNLLLTIIFGILISLGWLAGSTWFGVVFTILWTQHHLRWAYQSVVVGFRAGSRAKTEPRK